MKNSAPSNAAARLEMIMDELAEGLSNDAEIDGLKSLVWAAFESMPTRQHPHFLEKMSSIEKRMSQR